jgi:hypothetical protein
VAPPERQYNRNDRSDSASYGDDRRRGYHLGRGAGRHESGPLANDHTHVGNAESLSPPFVWHPDHEGGVGCDLVNAERG